MTDDFWSTRTVLAHIRDLARARMVGPYAVLAYAIADALSTVPPYIKTPPIVGGPGSLNMCIAIVGASGAGKGTAAAAARDGVVCSYPVGPIPRVPIGSGEGIARTYRPAGTSTDPDSPNHVTSAIFTAEEIDTWAAIASRSGSTLSAEVRKMYSGEQLGFGNAGKDTRNIVQAHSYRALTVVGVQPDRSGPILTAADGGLPQRFWWVPASDPDAPDESPQDPDQHLVGSAEWHSEVSSGNLPSGILEIPEAARSTIIHARRAVLREESGADPLAAHALLTRLKVAAGLMALDGHGAISDADWTLAGHLMEISDQTRQRCQRALAETSRRTNTARALATAERDEIVSDRKLQRARGAILRRLGVHRQQTKNQLRMGLKADVRDYLDPAISDLLDTGQIIVSAGKFSLPEGHMSQGHVPRKSRSTSNDAVCPSGTYVPSPRDLADRRRSRQRQRTRGANRIAQQTDDEASA